MKEISIGEFARQSRLSLKALRLYDERGVLLPSASTGAWEQEQEHKGERLALTPEDLGLRTTYLAAGSVAATSVPDDYCDLALPSAVER